MITTIHVPVLLIFELTGREISIVTEIGIVSHCGGLGKT